MKKSINAWSVDKSICFEDMFCRVKTAGFDGIELNIDSENNSAHSLALSSSKKQLDEIKILSEKYNLPVVSISTSLFGSNMGSAQQHERKTAQSLIIKQLEYAEKLGATGILIVPGGLSENVSLQTARENSLKTILDIKTEIEDIGIFVGVENVWNRFFMSPYDMCRFIDELDSAYIGAYFDVGNVVEFSDPENWIEILGGRIGKVHVKDFKRRNGVYSGGEWVDLLSGSVNWTKVVSALKIAGFTGYLTAEVEKTNPLQTQNEFCTMVASELENIICMEDEI